LVEIVIPDGDLLISFCDLSVIFTKKSEDCFVDIGFLMPLTVILKVCKILIWVKVDFKSIATFIELDSNALLNEQVTELNIVVSVEEQDKDDSEVGRVISGGNWIITKWDSITGTVGVIKN